MLRTRRAERQWTDPNRSRSSRVPEGRLAARVAAHKRPIATDLMTLWLLIRMRSESKQYSHSRAEQSAPGEAECPGHNGAGCGGTAEVDVRERSTRGHVPEADGAGRAGCEQPSERRRGSARVRVIGRRARLEPGHTDDALCSSTRHITANQVHKHSFTDLIFSHFIHFLSFHFILGQSNPNPVHIRNRICANTVC